MPISASTTSVDREKFLSKKLLERAQYKLVMKSVVDTDGIKMPDGAGTTGYMVRYKRLTLPTAVLTEGTAPNENTSMALDEVTVTMEQWGDYVIITDVAEWTTAHPLHQIVDELLQDSAARLMDFNIQQVVLAGTNRIYGDLSATARSGVTSSMKVSSLTASYIVTRLKRAGVPSWGKTSFDAKAKAATQGTIDGGYYMAVTGPEVQADIENDATFISVAQYNNHMQLVNSEIGMWKGVKWIITNFTPIYQVYGNTTTAVSSGSTLGATGSPVVTAVNGGGTLLSATTYYFVVTRKLKDAPFEDKISIEHTMASAATGDNESFTFNFSSCSTLYYYNIYFGASSGNLLLHTENYTAGGTVTVTAVPGSGAAPPTAPGSAGVAAAPGVAPIMFFGSKAVAWTNFKNLRYIRKGGENDTSDLSDPLNQRRTNGYKFMGKTVIMDQNRLLIWEVATGVAPSTA